MSVSSLPLWFTLNKTQRTGNWKPQPFYFLQNYSLSVHERSQFQQHGLLSAFLYFISQYIKSCSCLFFFIRTGIFFKKTLIIIVANILNIYYVRSHGLITLHAFSDLIFYVVYHKNLPCWLFVMQISRPCPWRFQVNRSGVRCKTTSLDSFKEGSTLNSAVFNTHARSF